MSGITDIKKVGNEAATPKGKAFNQAIDKLQKKEYKYANDLWEAIGRDFQKGISELASTTDIPHEVLVEILADSSRDLKTELSGWRRGVKFWPEVLATLIGLALMSVLLVHAFEREGVVFVAGESGLPPFHVITKEDVKVENSIYVPGSFISQEEVVGRYLLQRVSGNSRLFAHHLSKVKLLDAAERQVISVPVKAAAISASLSPPDRVSLLFTPRKSEEEDEKKSDEKNTNLSGTEELFRVDDVVVLAVNRQGESSSLVVAIKADIGRMGNLIGSSDTLVLQPMTR